MLPRIFGTTTADTISRRWLLELHKPTCLFRTHVHQMCVTCLQQTTQTTGPTQFIWMYIVCMNIFSPVHFLTYSFQECIYIVCTSFCSTRALFVHAVMLLTTTQPQLGYSANFIYRIGPGEISELP